MRDIVIHGMSAEMEDVLVERATQAGQSVDHYVIAILVRALARPSEEELARQLDDLVRAERHGR